MRYLRPGSFDERCYAFCNLQFCKSHSFMKSAQKVGKGVWGVRATDVSELSTETETENVGAPINFEVGAPDRIEVIFRGLISGPVSIAWTN